MEICAFNVCMMRGEREDEERKDERKREGGDRDDRCEKQK